MTRTQHQRVRALALAAALSTVGTGLLAAPAHAAPTPSPSTSSSRASASSTSSSSTGGASREQTPSPPVAADPDDQNAVDSLWQQILDKLGLGKEEDGDSTGGSEQALPRAEQQEDDGNPFAAAGPFADPDDALARKAEQLRSSDLDAAAAVERIAEGGVALWVGDWTPTATVAATVHYVAQRAEDAGKTAVITTYALPARDCGSYSAGGLSPDAYGAWMKQVAAGVKGTGAAVVVEPDAIAQLGQCDGQGDRLGLLDDAVEVLADAGAHVYLDAGNSGWTGDKVDTIVDRLRKAGVQDARGFAVNVSNFGSDKDERAYAEQLSDQLDGAHFVVDTSHNGAGSNGEWCNPSGRALGKSPGAVQDGSHQDANLWIKRAGESDGTCNGGPAAGTLWTDAAIDLAG